MKTMRQIVLIGFVASSCVGCAVMNPYVHPRDGDEYLDMKPSVALEGDIVKAVDNADKWRFAYRKAAMQHTVMRNTSAAIILPLSAASLFYGITGHGSSDRIARMAIGSAGLYGANQFLTSEPRQALYLEGAKALTCAIAASRPFMVTQGDFTAFINTTKNLTNTNANLVQAITKLEGAINGMVTQKAIKDRTTELELDAANKAVVSAKDASTAAGVLLEKSKAAQRTIKLSGQTLYDATRAIVDTVYIEIGKTQPDLNALKTIASGLSTQAETFGQSHLPKPAAEVTTKAQVSAEARNAQRDDLDAKIREKTEKRDAFITEKSKILAMGAVDDPAKKHQPSKLDLAEIGLKQLSVEIAALEKARSSPTPLENLVSARTNLYTAQSDVAKDASFVNLELVGMDNLAKQAEAVSLCKVADATIPFTVLPAGDTLTIKKEKAATLTAQGGTLTPRFQLLGVNTDKIKVDQVAQTSSVLVLTITAGKEAVAATAAPTLVLTDGSGKKSVQVKVVITD